MKIASLSRVFLLSFLLWPFGEALAGVVDQPVGCFEGRLYPCSLHNNQDLTLVTEKTSLEIRLGAGSAIFILAEDEYRLIQGSVWIGNVDLAEVLVRSEYGHFRLRPGEDLFIRQEPQEVLARSLRGQSEVSSRDGLFIEDLPVGFEVRLGPVRSGGRNKVSIIAPASVEHWADWAPFLMREDDQDQALLVDFIQARQEAVRESARLYQSVIDRRIASAKEEKLEREARQRAWQAERERVRDLVMRRLKLDSHLDIADPEN